MREQEFDPRDAATLGWAIESLALGGFVRVAAHRRFTERPTEDAADASRLTSLFTWRMVTRAGEALAGAACDGPLRPARDAAAALIGAVTLVWRREGMLLELLVQGRFDEMQDAYDSIPAPDDTTPEWRALASAVADLARDAPGAWEALGLGPDVIALLADELDLPATEGRFAA